MDTEFVRKHFVFGCKDLIDCIPHTLGVKKGGIQSLVILFLEGRTPRGIRFTH